jgi:TolB protein
MMMKVKTKINYKAIIICHYFFAFIIIYLFNTTFSHSKIEISINDGISEALPIAISEFNGDNLDSIEFGAKIKEVLVNDLENSGLFRVIDNEAFLEMPAFNKTPVFTNWRTINANMLLVVKVNLDRENNFVNVSYKLYDTFKEKEVENGEYKIVTDGWRRIAHKIANSVYKKFLGVEGYFDSRIIFISEKGDERNRIKRLAIMDQDGANFKFLTNGDELTLSPRFDPKSQRIAFMSYKNRKQPPKVYVLDLETGEQDLVGDMSGMTFAPYFAPDNNHIIMSLAKKGTTNIYEIDLNSRIKKELTSSSGGIDTSPSYSPDGNNILFNSDRAGARSQIYTMDRSGSNINRVSKGEGSYRTPTWSPDGKWIAFTKILSGNFYIGIMKPDGSDERLLTSSWLEEGPSWAPNSRTIIFSRQKRTGENKLYAIDIDGNNERLFYSPTNGSQPSWSAHLN